MARIALSQMVQAPVAAVFAAASDFANAPTRIKDIVRVEMLTPGPVGVGTKFKETRVMFKKEATETMEVTAFEPNAAYELSARSCGAEFKTRFAFAPVGDATRIDVTVTTRAVSLFAKLFTPLGFLMKGMLRKCMVRDLEQLRDSIEGKTA